MEDSDCFSLIDENDSLISPEVADDDSSLTHLHSGDIGDIGGDRVDGTDLSNKCGEQLPQLSETAEPEIPRKTGKFNLRKSLAWDKAFFESPGFLDAEEISTMIDGAEKGKMHLLPAIDEDISRSTDSVSTLASENLAVESLENELFKDIRASIQKSSLSTSNRKAAPKETDKLGKSVKVDNTSRNGSARNVTSKRQTGGMQGSGRISKKDSTSALATQPGLRNGNSSSSLPQPLKVITKPEVMPAVTTKRAFLGANRIKTETNNSKVGGKGVQVHVPTAVGLAGPRRSVPKPASLLKALGSASSVGTIKEVGKSSCSSNGSKSTYTEKIQKSTLASARTKTISRPVIQASSKIPLSKKPPGKSGLQSSSTSSKISLSISPSSSISEWSSTSSSTSTANRKLTSRTNIDTNSSCRSMDSDTPSILCSDVQSNDGFSDGIPNQFKESPGQDKKKTNAQNHVLSRSVLMKPSGLRMPSPKIGFFDGAKSVVHTPNPCRPSQLCLPTGLPKIGASIRSPVGSSKKAEGNIQSGKKAISSANTVLNTTKSSSPRPSQESSRTSMKGEGGSRSVLSPNISSKVRSSNKGTGRPWPEMTLTSTEIELKSQKSDSPKSFQESVSPGRSPEQSQSHLPTSLPKSIAAVYSPFGSSKKIEGNILATSGANTVLDTSKSAAPKPSPGSRASMKGHGNHRSVISPDISSEVGSSNEGSGKPWSKMTLTITKTELEGQKSDSVKPFQEIVFVGVSPEQSQSCLPTSSPEIGASTCDPVGSSKKEGKIPIGVKATSVAITVLDTSKSASPTPSQESSNVLIKCHDDTESVSSPNISSDMRISNKGIGKPWPEMTLTSTEIELEGQKTDSPKPFQGSACPGVSQSQSQLQSPTSLPKIGAAVHCPVGSSKKIERNIPAGNKTSGANTVLDPSESTFPEPSQESSRDSIKGHGDHRSLLSPEISSEATSSDEVTRKPCSELSLTNKNIELEGKKSESPKPFQDSACPDVPQEQFQSQLPTCLPKIGTAKHSPVGSSKKAEGFIPSGTKTSGANTMLHMSESATPEPSQESSSYSVKSNGDQRNLLSPYISSEATSSDEVIKKLCSELSLTNTNIELEGQKSDSAKPFQESASFGLVPEHQSCLPTGSPKIEAAIRNPVGGSKKEGQILAGEKATAWASTVLDTSKSASPTPSQESSRVLIKCHDDTESVSSLNISSDMRISNKGTGKPWPEMILTSTEIELEGQKTDSPKPFQGSACPGVFQPQSQSQSPTSLPKIGSAVHSPVLSSKKVEGNILAGNKTSGANTVLDTSESAFPEPSQESSRDSIKGHGDHRSLLSLQISSEATSSDEVTRKPCLELSLTSTNIELEGQKPDSPKPFQDSACHDVPQEQFQSQLPTCLPKIGTAIHSPVGSSKKAEGFIPSGKKTSGANTMLYMSESATPEPSQESSRYLMKSNGDQRSLLSPYISSEVTSSDEVIEKLCSELSLTSTNIELEGQKSDSAKPFQESASFGLAVAHQSCLPTSSPKIEAAIYNPVGGSKNEGTILAGEKATAGASTVLDTSKSASPKPSQESLRASMEGLGDPWKLSPSISSEGRSSNTGSGKPWSDITLTSTNIELEGQLSDFSRPIQECTSPVASPEILNEIDISNCVKAEDVKVGKLDGAEQATANVPEAENDENLLLNI